MSSLVEKFQSMSYGPAPESPVEANAWLDRHSRKFGHYINGAWTKPTANEYFATENPATGEKLADIAQGSAADVDSAVRAARAALPAWQALSGHERARYLYAIARQIQKHSRLLAVLETMDNGKTIRETRDIDVPLVARHFYHHAGWAQLLDKEFPNYTACGVVGQIIPWNFPLLMLAWKIAPALAAGNTLVLKPAEFTPVSALMFAEICQEVGLPAGVVNIINGDGRTGEALVMHTEIDKIAFTGSTEVGRIIRKATAKSHKKLSLELGGKSPFIVFDDADLDSAVEGLVDGIWFNQGQVCCAGSRLLVQERVADVMIAKLRARMETLRIGDPLDKAMDIGAIVARVQLERIQGLVAQGVKEGATCYQPQTALPAKGLFFPPTMLTNVHPTSTVAQQEIFGPVLSVMTFRTLHESVELANNTVYGLASSVWSENINVALDVASRIKAGVVWINGTNMFDAACGFGGYRESGYGREGGKEGMYEYLEPVWFKNAPKLPAQYPSPQNSLVDSSLTTPLTTPAASSDSTTSRVSSASSVSSVLKNNLEVPIDRTVKQYIGGKQARPDSGYSFPVHAADGTLIGEAPLGNRKDIRNAVEAARKAEGWAKAAAHTRAQVLYYIGENLIQRRDEVAARLARFHSVTAAVLKTPEASRDSTTPKVSPSLSFSVVNKEVDLSIERIFTYAAWADKFDGLVHNPPGRYVSTAMNEPVGTIGIVCPSQAPLLGFLSLVLPAIAMGNTVVAVPSEVDPLIAADLYQVFDTSDLPGGVVNIVCGRAAELTKTLAEHDDLDAIWFFGDETGCASVKAASIGNLKQVWTNEGRAIDWTNRDHAEGRLFLHHACQVKNIWVPYGE